MQDTNFELDSMNLAEPYNMEAEQSVLGAALLDSERVMPALINTLKPEMFYSRQNAEIFSQMVELYSGTEQLDAVTLIDAVASTGVFESMEAAKVWARWCPPSATSPPMPALWRRNTSPAR